MFNPFDQNEDGADTVFKDVVFLALAGFIMLVLLLLPHLNPRAKTEEAVHAPGNVIIEARWPDDVDADVDLWTLAPGDRPVGYSRPHGLILDLLRDDLGNRADPTGLNYEFVYSRGAPVGEYTVNLHLYRSRDGRVPIEVRVVMSVKPQAGPVRQVYAGVVPLHRPGEERTVARFRLDEHGALVPGSLNDLPRPLRSAS